MNGFKFLPEENIKKVRKDAMAVAGISGIAVLFLISLCAPLIANNKPFLVYGPDALLFPFLRFFFAPDANEKFVEKTFNFLMLFLPFFFICNFVLRGDKKNQKILLVAGIGAILAIPFFTTQTRMDRTDWKKKVETENLFSIFAPVSYGPFESSATPYEKPSWKHILGTDQIGRDIFARMVYGTRVSLAVGIAATLLTLLIGTFVGLVSGYYGGKIDLVLMRIVEIIICFPTFLLLLILMAIFSDKKFDQSILIVILVIGLTSWTGLSRIIRGEVLQQRQMPYVKSGEALGLPIDRILFVHILPNVSAPIFVSFTFGIAGAILAESGLSFLGFGVQAPTASWGELLRQAFADPVTYWTLTLWPGFAIFAAVVSFNFAGEGLRKILDPKN